MPADTPDDSYWDSDTYDDSHSFVYEYGTDVVEFLEPRTSDRVLDLGCGTGHLTATIAEQVESIVGVDRSREMITTARSEHPTHRFVRGDARALPVAGPFDAVFSNAALHWIPGEDHDAVLSEVRAVLAPDGRFVAELGGHGNVATIVDAVQAELAERGHDVGNPWYFPSVGEYAPRLEAHGFKVTAAFLFDRPTKLDGDDGLTNWLEMFADRFFEDVPGATRAEIFSAVEDRTRDDLYWDGAWHADYRRLRFVAEKQP